MKLTARQFLICLVILLIIGGLKAYSPKAYPKPASCESDKDCLKGKAKCIRRECKCTVAYSYGDGKLKCDQWKKCKYEVCVEGADSRTHHSHCLENPQSEENVTCKCNMGFFGRPSHPRCMNKEKKGGKYPCLSDKNCATFAFCKNNWCKCSQELIGDGEKCEPPPPTKCTSNKPCKAKKGKCLDSFCRCKGNFVGNGVFCRNAKTCKLECGAGRCLIDPLYPNIEKCVCYPDTDITQAGLCVDKKCERDKDCNKKYKYAICEEGSCTCKEELILDKKSKTCKPAPMHACGYDKDCHSDAKCQDGKCICQGTRTGNGKNCRDSALCNKYCGPGGTCLKEKLLNDDPVCRCDKGFYRTKGGKCVECTNNADCSNANCTEGECKCKDEQIKEGRICKRAPPHSCNTREDCHENAECYERKCKCSRKHQTGNGKYCRDSRPCKKEDEEKCKTGGKGVISCVVDPLFDYQPECKCHLGYNTSEAGICAEIKECENDGHGCPPGAFCESQNASYYRCTCRKGYKDISLGKGNITCQDVDECSQKQPCLGKHNSVCKNTEGDFKCECIPGFRESADESACEAVPNLICRKEACECADGFASNSNNECEDVDECVQNKTLCSANEQCINGEGSFYCVCRSGYRREDKVCVNKGECKCTQHQICVEGECKCNDGYKKTLKGYCVPRRQHLDDSLGLSLHSIGFPSTLFLCLPMYLAFTE